MKILFDSKGLQAFHHLYDKKRLCSLITELILLDFDVRFSNNNSLNLDLLSQYDILIITTRKPNPNFQFKDLEMESIHNFVNNGGGLLLMTNHADCVELNNNSDLTINDSHLAEKFDVVIEKTWFENKHRINNLTIIYNNSFNNEHPIIKGISVINKVNTITINNCSSIKPSNDIEIIIKIPREMKDYRNNNNRNEENIFACSLELNNGRAFFITDSGFIGSEGTKYPGPGLINYGDNNKFILNTIKWLGREL